MRQQTVLGFIQQIDVEIARIREQLPGSMELQQRMIVRITPRFRGKALHRIGGHDVIGEQTLRLFAVKKIPEVANHARVGTNDIRNTRHIQLLGLAVAMMMRSESVTQTDTSGNFRCTSYKTIRRSSGSSS